MEDGKDRLALRRVASDSCGQVAAARRRPSFVVEVLLGVAVLAAAPADVAAQLAASGSDRTPRRFEVGVAVGAFLEMPDAFSSNGCFETASTFSAQGSWWPTSRVGVDGATLVSGEFAAQCAYDLLPGPIVGDSFERTSYADGVPGVDFTASQLGVVVAPWPVSPVSPRLRTGLGRIWDKSITFLYVGTGVRYRFGRHALVTDLEWWRMGFDSNRERLVLTPAGTIQVLSSEAVRVTDPTYRFRVGWEIELR